MQSALCTGHRTIELREVARPEVSDGNVVVRIRRCGICGSDLHFFHGGFPAPPVCPGHEISAEVAQVGRGVSQLLEGDLVAVQPLVVCRECAFCRSGDYQLCRGMQILGNSLEGGFAEYVAVPGYALFQLPRGVDVELGALAEPLAVSVHAARIGGIRIGDRVLVQGAGTIGLTAIAAARAAGAGDVWATARHPQQALAAQRLGASRVFTGPHAEAELSDASDTGAIDVVIETVGGTSDTLTIATHLVRRGGTIVVLGIFTAAPAINPLLLVLKEIRLIGSIVYGRTAARADFDIALDLLARQPEVFRSLITHRFALSDLQQGFETAADKQSGAIKVSIEP
jgi:2-desacetyl-2-hydroxyethyl bacteriochlorophyllide A dehydrogenase